MITGVKKIDDSNIDVYFVVESYSLFRYITVNRIISDGKVLSPLSRNFYGCYWVEIEEYGHLP
ncbi:hypothetical protein MU1_51360 [Paenibacillus glycanilyticus]|uniref:Uncharacterized protein n=1 Tax=Paenibacillus glycanilyticus TaxID=126569 RepID=A0ABQ6GIK8_9BACL|nr:hypothetical protein MU1_51360 [Paenibacillus glycanilyticus]